MTPFEKYQFLFDELVVRRQLFGCLSDDEEAERAQQMLEIWETLDASTRVDLEAWVGDQKRKIPVHAPEDLGLVDLADPSRRPYRLQGDP